MESDTLDILRDHGNILWTCLAAFLVFFMQAGFALVEAGFTRAKHVCNIIMKNLMDRLNNLLNPLNCCGKCGCGKDCKECK